MNKKIENKLKKITPTFKEYFEAKRVVEKYENILNDEFRTKKFYVQMPSNHYSVGVFGGWEGGNFLLKIEDVEPCSHIKDTHYVSTPIEDVFEKKQKNMIHLHAGVE